MRIHIILTIYWICWFFDTAGFMKTVPFLTEQIYQSHSTQVPEGIVFRKHTVLRFKKIVNNYVKKSE